MPGGIFARLANVDQSDLTLFELFAGFVDVDADEGLARILYSHFLSPA
jgi:hypothetical protein